MKVSSILNNKYLLFITIFIVKIVILSFLIFSYNKGNSGSGKLVSGFVFKSNDYTYFLQPVDNYFETGNFSYGLGKPYAGRMPAYWIVYWGLRLIFSQNISLIVMIIFQVVLSSLASIYFAKTVFRLTKKMKAYWIALIISTFSLYTISYDIQTQTESLAISAMIFFLYHYLCYYENSGNSRKHLILAGLFLAWAIFLRLYLGIMLPIICFLIVLSVWKETKSINLKKMFVHCLLFISPFVFFDSLWIIRNYNTLGKFIPLESALNDSYGKLYPKSWTKIRSLIVIMGQDPAYFEPNTLGKWFKDERDTLPFSFEKRKFSGLCFNADSISELKRNYNLFINETDSSKEKRIEQKIILTTDKYIADFKAKRSLEVHFKNPLMRFKKYIFASGSGYLLLAPLSKMNLIEKAVKYATSAYYYFILVFGALFVLRKKIWKSIDPLKHFVLLGVLALITNILVIVYISDIQENRYFMPVFPFLMLFVTIHLSTINFNFRSPQKK